MNLYLKGTEHSLAKYLQNLVIFSCRAIWHRLRVSECNNFCWRVSLYPTHWIRQVTVDNFFLISFNFVLLFFSCFISLFDRHRYYSCYWVAQKLTYNWNRWCYLCYSKEKDTLLFPGNFQHQIEGERSYCRCTRCPVANTIRLSRFLLQATYVTTFLPVIVWFTYPSENKGNSSVWWCVKYRKGQADIIIER